MRLTGIGNLSFHVLLPNLFFDLLARVIERVLSLPSSLYSFYLLSRKNRTRDRMTGVGIIGSLSQYRGSKGHSTGDLRVTVQGIIAYHLIHRVTIQGIGLQEY